MTVFHLGHHPGNRGNDGVPPSASPRKSRQRRCSTLGVTPEIAATTVFHPRRHPGNRGSDYPGSRGAIAAGHAPPGVRLPP
jgi:hypothetical protein